MVNLGAIVTLVVATVTVVATAHFLLLQRKRQIKDGEEPDASPAAAVAGSASKLTPTQPASSATKAPAAAKERVGHDSGEVGVDTLAAGAGTADGYPTGDVSAPLHLSSTFRRAPDLSHPGGIVYTRSGNPTRQALEQALTKLEGGEDSAAFSSGMAAASAVLQAAGPKTHVILSSDVYFGVRHLLQTTYAEWGMTFSEVDPRDLASVRRRLTAAAAVPGKNTLVWLEMPTNPMLRICDLEAVANQAHACGALVLVDSTWLTPVLFQPFKLGADFVLHSCTKYLGGHSDLLAGSVTVSSSPRPYASALFSKVRALQQEAGAVASPFDCWMCMRGIRSLSARMQRHCENAVKVANWLASHPAVETVLYPGHPSFEQHELAAAQMAKGAPSSASFAGFGGMMSFLVKGGRDSAVYVAGHVKVVTQATSLGGTESLIEHRQSIEGPTTATPANLLRLSVGLEDPTDIIKDLDSALRASQSA